MAGPAPASPSVLRMALPLVVSFWMRAAVTLVDTLYAALLGDEAVAAVGLTIPLEFVMIAAWVGLSTGLTSALSRAMAAGAHTRVEQYLRIGWRIVFLLSPLFTLVGALVWVAAPRMGLEQGVERAFQLYGTVLIVGSAFTTFWSILPDSLVKAHQDTRSTMWAGIWTNVINLGLNSVFVFVFHWGLFGIAFSTVLGRIGGLSYALVRARRHEARRRAEAGAAVPLDPAPYRAILGLAVPSALTFALMATESGVVNWLLSRMAHPTEAIAAYSIYYRIVLFGLQPMIAASVAMLPYAARRFGVGDALGVRSGLRDLSLAASGYSLLVLGPAMLLAAPWLAAWLTESPLTAQYTTFCLRLVPLACLAGGPFLLCRPVFEALGRGRPGLVLAAVRYGLLTAPLAWLGIEVARSLAQPELYGVVAGTLLAAGLSSALLYGWLCAVLPPAGDPRNVEEAPDAV